jgi:hypothetical protein
MQIKTNGSGDHYVDVYNIRITVAHRPAGKDGDDSGRYLNISAYQDGTTGKLFPGADLPIRLEASDADIFWQRAVCSC